ncbi:MAG: YezD family protein [Lachnospiraceae bacterium]|nr:YezD family protein [Lachnospiraceae bacterium]
MERTKVTNEDLAKIKEFIEDVRFGSITVIVQDGKIIQIEKHEKVRLNSK